MILMDLQLILENKMVQNMANTVCSANADGKCRRITGETNKTPHNKQKITNRLILQDESHRAEEVNVGISDLIHSWAGRAITLALTLALKTLFCIPAVSTFLGCNSASNNQYSSLFPLQPLWHTRPNSTFYKSTDTIWNCRTHSPAAWADKHYLHVLKSIFVQYKLRVSQRGTGT